MTIDLRSRGGFTGKAGEEARRLDLDRLPGPEARALADLVERAGFFALPPELKKAAPRPWDFTHVLTVGDGGRSHTVTFHEDAAPPALRELVERLRALVDAGS